MKESKEKFIKRYLRIMSRNYMERHWLLFKSINHINTFIELFTPPKFEKYLDSLLVYCVIEYVKLSGRVPEWREGAP